ncbi:MAG: sulfotransferase [bacterium]|nr:sulfotransferase [bacterium]
MKGLRATSEQIAVRIARRTTPRGRVSLFRRMTASLRALPDFVVVGAQRSGTTSLYLYLKQHPRIIAAVRKEIHFFEQDTIYRRGLRWYRANFPIRLTLQFVGSGGGRGLCFEATPGYLFHPHAMPRLAEVLPEARFIVILRNPVDRAYSNYQKAFRDGRTDLSFETEVDRELTVGTRATEAPPEEPPVRPFLGRSLYADQLQRMFEHVSRERVLVLQSERLFSHTQDAFDELCAFLGLPSCTLCHTDNRTSGGYSSTMPPELRERLVDYFAPQVQRLQSLLEEPFSWPEWQ